MSRRILYNQVLLREHREKKSVQIHSNASFIHSCFFPHMKIRSYDACDCIVNDDGTIISHLPTPLRYEEQMRRRWGEGGETVGRRWGEGGEEEVGRSGEEYFFTHMAAYRNSHAWNRTIILQKMNRYAKVDKNRHP